MFQIDSLFDLMGRREQLESKFGKCTASQSFELGGFMLHANWIAKLDCKCGDRFKLRDNPVSIHFNCFNECLFILLLTSHMNKQVTDSSILLIAISSLCREEMAKPLVFVFVYF
jgi:hypothetical protein